MKRRTLAGLGVFAAGAVAGAAIEGLLSRRLLGAQDAARTEALGSLRGERATIDAFDGTPLAVECFGDPGAPVLVLLHGVVNTRRIWHYQVRDLADRFRIVTYDARGHGESGPARGPDGRTQPTVAVLARDLQTVLDQMGVRRCVLSGHSMGGMTALQLAETAPQELGRRLAGFVLVNTTFTGSVAVWREDRVRYQAVRSVAGTAAAGTAGVALLRAAARFPANDLSLIITRVLFGRAPSRTHVAWCHQMFRETSPDTLASLGASLAAFELVHVLEGVRVPTLVIAGERDLLTPAWLSKEIAERIPDARLIVLPGTGHLSLLERHAEVTRRIGEFAARMSAPDVTLPAWTR